MERRTFLTGILGLSGMALLNEACRPVTQLASTSKPAPVENFQASEDPKRQAVAEIHALPDSNIKKALESRIVPLLEAKLPFTLNFTDVEIVVNNMTVEETLTHGSETRVDASYNGRKTTSTAYHPVSTFDTKIPGLAIVKPSEASQIPAASKLPDGTWFLNFNGTPSGFIDRTIHPHISVNVRWSGTPTSADYVPVLRSYGYVKEACSFLLDILRIEATIEKMKQFGLLTNIDARDPNGKVENITIIPEAFAAISGQKGRSQALLDMAGYLLSLKALTQSPSYQTMVYSGALDRSFVPLIARADLGTSDRDIFLKSFEWALNTPEAQRFPHQGDISKIP